MRDIIVPHQWRRDIIVSHQWRRYIIVPHQWRRDIIVPPSVNERHNSLPISDGET
jgi:PhoPQ-activated pathogenicity-related protein